MLHPCPMGIWVRIGPQHSLAVRKRRTNGVSPAASVQSGQLLSPATYVDTGGGGVSLCR